MTSQRGTNREEWMIGTQSGTQRTRPEAKCPLRPHEVCNLCQMNVTGPHDCGLVYLVMSDPDLRAEWGERRHVSR